MELKIKTLVNLTAMLFISSFFILHPSSLQGREWSREIRMTFDGVQLYR